MISLTQIGPHDPLPSLLPVGDSQAARLFEPGPARAMGWLAGSGPTGPDRRHTALARTRIWRCPGVSWPKAQQRAIIGSTSSYTPLRQQNDLSGATRGA